MKDKGKFKSVIRNNALYRKFIQKQWYRFVTYLEISKRSRNSNQSLFFSLNSDRVSAVATLLADEKSKKTYLDMVKFRQTFKKKNFPFSCYEKVQYFIDELKLNNNEVFIDCGAFDGDTIDNFLKHCINYKQIIAFEPQIELFATLKKKYDNNSKINLINAGVFDKDGEVLFFEGSYSDSKIVDETTEKSGNNIVEIKVKTIDGLNLQNVSFIKMDIEGSEYNALKGAQKTILRDKPKLAISIYHSDEDMIRIAEYIHELVPEYKFYIRQHQPYPIHYDTVLYALL